MFSKIICTSNVSTAYENTRNIKTKQTCEFYTILKTKHINQFQMNSILARAGSSLAKNAFRCPNSIRALSTFNTKILVSSLSKNDHISNISKYTLDSTKTSISMSKRFYSSEKFTSSQIEEKVLEIIKNFDRVKENPAKPEVRPIFLLEIKIFN